jgi:hypothetical protein
MVFGVPPVQVKPAGRIGEAVKVSSLEVQNRQDAAKDALWRNLFLFIGSSICAHESAYISERLRTGLVATTEV